MGQTYSLMDAVRDRLRHAPASEHDRLATGEVKRQAVLEAGAPGV